MFALSLLASALSFSLVSNISRLHSARRILSIGKKKDVSESKDMADLKKEVEMVRTALHSLGCACCSGALKYTLFFKIFDTG